MAGATGHCAGGQGGAGVVLWPGSVQSGTVQLTEQSGALQLTWSGVVTAGDPSLTIRLAAQEPELAPLLTLSAQCPTLPPCPDVPAPMPLSGMPRQGENPEAALLEEFRQLPDPSNRLHQIPAGGGRVVRSSSQSFCCPK